MPSVDGQLQAMRQLTENWDGYGAAAPSAAVVEFAREFAGFLEAALAKSTTCPTALHVSPTRVGGVLIEWEDQAMEHEVEVNPDRGLSFLHMQKATGQITTRQFNPGVEMVIDPGLLQELRQLLAA